MEKYTLITNDKVISKNGSSEFFEDNNFWSNYSSIHAIQIDINGISNVENKDGTQYTPTQNEINNVINKYNIELQKRIDSQQEEINNYNNSWDRVRSERDYFILNTDKYLLSDFPISNEIVIDIKNYRSLLRDLPNTYSNQEPKNIVFDESGNVKVNENIVITKPSV